MIKLPDLSQSEPKLDSLTFLLC